MISKTKLVTWTIYLPLISFVSTSLSQCILSFCPLNLHKCLRKSPKMLIFCNFFIFKNTLSFASGQQKCSRKNTLFSHILFYTFLCIYPSNQSMRIKKIFEKITKISTTLFFWDPLNRCGGHLLFSILKNCNQDLLLMIHPFAYPRDRNVRRHG